VAIQTTKVDQQYVKILIQILSSVLCLERIECLQLLIEIEVDFRRFIRAVSHCPDNEYHKVCEEFRAHLNQLLQQNKGNLEDVSADI
jgi:hypothetical protein